MEVVRWSEEHLGRRPLEWVELALGRQLAHRAGRLVHRRALTTVARQNTKTTGGAEPLIGWWLTDYAAMVGAPQTVLNTTHDLFLAEETFDRLAPVLEVRFGAKPYWSRGAKHLFMPDGSKWHCRAATPRVGHGLSIDLAVVDELWNVERSPVVNGILPAQRARPSPLCSAWSTAGEEGSEMMHAWREQGMLAIERGEPGGVCFTEWSPPSDADPDDERWWPWANPGLGYLPGLTVEVMREEREADRRAFMRGGLNMWVAASRGWLEPGVWDSCRTAPVPLEGGVLAVDVSADTERWVGVRAGLVDGRAHVRVEFVVDSETATWEQIDRLLTDDKAVRLAIGLNLQIHLPERWKRRHQLVSTGDISRWTGLVQSMIREGKVTHDGGALLAEQVNRAVAAKGGDGAPALNQAKSPGPIELCRQMVLAVTLVAVPQSSGKPVIGFSRR